MTVKQIREAFAKFSDDAEVFASGLPIEKIHAGRVIEVANVSRPAVFIETGDDIISDAFSLRCNPTLAKLIR